jgi:ammonia channel protein AmtB
LSFSISGSRFIGDLAHVVSIDVLDGPALGTLPVPEIGFCFFQLMFAATSTTSTSM